MSDAARRYGKVAGGFGDRVDGVPAGAWDRPAPCEGWVARDVVGHLVDWISAFPLARVGVGPPVGPPVSDDPAGAWHALDDAIRAALADPAVASRTMDTPMGEVTFEQAVATFCLPDILVHTWDLARATGLDERLDADEVHQLYEGIQPMDAVLRESGQYGPRVEVAGDADEQTRLIAFTGRHP
jgi:uncharacterized protein (TIGR03086 family)